MIVPILACPVCIGAGVKNAAAFGATTIFLSALPLAAVLGFLAYLKHRTRQLDAAADSPR